MSELLFDLPKCLEGPWRGKKPHQFLWLTPASAQQSRQCPCWAWEQPQCLHTAESWWPEGKPYTEHSTHTIEDGNFCKAWLRISNCLPASNWQPKDQNYRGSFSCCHKKGNLCSFYLNSFVLTLFFTIFIFRVAILWDSWCWQISYLKLKA